MRYSIEQINNISCDEFLKIFGNVIELYSAVSKDVCKKRPYNDVNEFINAFHKYLDNITEEEKIHILRLHPDLAGKMAEEGALTVESTKEQNSAGLDQASQEEKRVIRHYNQSYKDKFGFPFIICARENKVKSIIQGLMERYNNVKEMEISNAISEVKKICQLRILDLIK